MLAFTGLATLVAGLILAPGSGCRHATVVGLLAVGAITLIAFVRHEAHSSALLMPLGLFGSRMFSGVNALTLLLYGALGGAFFFLLFDLIQVHGFSATEAGAAFLPFTVIMAALSRWSGGLIERFGARAPLTVGPLIVAMGFALLALPGTGGSYWTTFFVPMVILDLGMAIAVAPLTTAVMNAVDRSRSGIASGINNAVATLASLLAVAIFGAVALAVSGHAIDQTLPEASLSPLARAAIESMRGKFAADQTLSTLSGADREVAAAAARHALASGIHAAMWLAAGLSLAGALCAALTTGSQLTPERAAGSVAAAHAVPTGRPVLAPAGAASTTSISCGSIPRSRKPGQAGEATLSISISSTWFRVTGGRGSISAMKARTDQAAKGIGIRTGCLPMRSPIAFSSSR
jgi:hypothetical protein